MNWSKIFVIALCVALIASPLYAATLDVQAVVPHSVNELPFYGNIEKTEAMKQADAQFKATAIEKAGTPEKAAGYFANHAWEAFQNGELNNAMKFANQAWLLDDKNYSAYWVMALIQRFRGASREDVDALFKKAILYVSGSDQPRLAQDYQTFLNGKDDAHIDNADAIAEQYRKAQITLTGK